LLENGELAWLDRGNWRRGQSCIGEGCKQGRARSPNTLNRSPNESIRSKLATNGGQVGERERETWRRTLSMLDSRFDSVLCEGW
jgi:hypothetical protein